MPFERMRIPETIGNTTQIFHNTDAGYSKYEYNVFDKAFGVSSNNTSPTNSFFATAPSLLSSNTVNDLNGSPQTATPRLYTGRETGTLDFQNIPGCYQQHEQGSPSDIPRQLYLECRETECSPSPFTTNQQTPASIKLSSLSSPMNPPSTVEAIEQAPILDESGQTNSTTKRQFQTGLNTGRIERALPKEGRGSRKIRAYTKRKTAATREKHLLRNRQAAHKCREKKKAWITVLAEKAELFTANNARLPYEIVQTMLELEGLKLIALEHYSVCPSPSPELAAWFEKEAVRFQHSNNVSPLTPHADQSLTYPLQDANCTSHGTADTLPGLDLSPLCHGSDGFAPISPLH